MYGDIIDTYGNHIPYILFGSSIIFLNKSNVLLYYIPGFFINNFINIMLKHYIKDERPYWNHKSKYNMPSGHCQSTFYSIGFIFSYLYKNKLLNSNSLLILFYIINGYITIRNCIVYNYHTKDQTTFGTILGGIIGISTNILSK
jgi:membrane-associated phospholipid phosphatase